MCTHAIQFLFAQQCILQYMNQYIVVVLPHIAIYLNLFSIHDIHLYASVKTERCKAIKSAST